VNGAKPRRALHALTICAQRCLNDRIEAGRTVHNFHQCRRGKEVSSGQNTTLNGAIATPSAPTERAAVVIPVSFVVERERKC